jgi:hypothetical protein
MNIHRGHHQPNTTKCQVPTTSETANHSEPIPGVAAIPIATATINAVVALQCPPLRY